MRIAKLLLKDFRNYTDSELEFTDGVTVLFGSNGAGKTNLLEAIYAALTGRSFRSRNSRELIRSGSKAARVELAYIDQVGTEQKLVRSFHRSGQIESSDLQTTDLNRPLVICFFPDRMSLIKGAPALRRAHFDNLIKVLWPGRTETLKSYQESRQQFNALLVSSFGRQVDQHLFTAWEQELARLGVLVTEFRKEVNELISEEISKVLKQLSIDATLTCEYLATVKELSVEDYQEQLSERRINDLKRGFTTYGPHRDDVTFLFDELDLKKYGSQGQQRLSLLVTMIAEKNLLSEFTGQEPVVLLDDVMSELDYSRRALLMQLIVDTGQTLLTTTEIEHIPDQSKIGGSFLIDKGEIKPV